MRPENERRLTFQLVFLLIFWGAASFTMVVQEQHLPMEPTDIVEKMALRWNKPDPYTYYPLEYNPFNDRETLIEACIIWIGMFYGLLRLTNIMRIIGEDDRETAWETFWERVENLK